LDGFCIAAAFNTMRKTWWLDGRLLPEEGEQRELKMTHSNLSQEGIEIQCDAPFTLIGHHVCNVLKMTNPKERETEKERDEALYEMKDVNQDYR